MYKGIIFNVISSLLFVVSGYLVHFVLGATMTPAEYGVIGTIITILDFEYLFLSNGVRQSLSKEISKDKYDTADIVKKGLFFQIILIAIMFSINFFGAGIFAKALNDTSLNEYIKYAAFLIPINGLYVMTIGINEGFRKFISSATIGIVYAIFKLSAIPMVLFMFDDPIFGAETGFLTALIVALVTGIITLFFAKSQFKIRRKEKIGSAVYLKNTLSFSVFFIIVSVVLSVDTLIVKAIETNKDMAGFYTGAINFSKVSYFILSAFFTIILPTVTKYYTEKNEIKVKETISNMFSIILIFVMPITMIISASGKSLLSAFYGKEYEYAGTVLTILAISHFFMGLIVMFNMIISATNRRKFSSFLAVGMIAADVILCIVFTHLFGIKGTAAAGLICTTVVVLISGKYMLNIFNNVILKSHVKILVFNIIIWVIARIIFEVMNIGNIIILGLIYMGMYGLIILAMNLLHLANIKDIINKVKVKN